MINDKKEKIMDLGSKMKIGSFVVMKKMEGKKLFMVVGTIGGEWEMRYSARNMMFRVLDSVDNENRDAVHTLLATIYAAAHILDAKFTNAVVKAIKEYEASRLTMNEERLTKEEEESQRIIEEEKRVREMNDERLTIND